MRFSSLLRRRPSASLAVSFVALLVARGGVGCRAVATPATPAPTVTADATLNAIQTAPAS